MSRRVPLLAGVAAVLFVGSVLLGVAPARAANTATPAIELIDKTGDVKLLDPALGPPAPGAVADGLDITKASLFGESGSAFLLRVDLVKIDAETVFPPAAEKWVTVAMCFDWGPKHFAAIVQFRPAEGGTLYAPMLTALDAACSTAAPITAVPGKSTSLGYRVALDTPRNEITVSVPRKALGQVTGGQPPRAGDQIGKLYVVVSDMTTAGERTRYDTVPDAGPDAAVLTLASDTANLGDLVGSADPNVAPIPCDGRLDAPTYAFEAGGKRGVPVVFRNLRSEPRRVTFTVDTVDGLAWSPKVVPQLTIEPGNTTVNVIVDTPADSKHKDCSILRVRSVDAGDPAIQAEALVIAVAVRPPDKTTQRLYFHDNVFARDTCSGPDAWLNTLAEDPQDVNSPIYMKFCRDPAYLTNAPAGPFSVKLDVNPNKDLIVNTSASGKPSKAILVLQSDHVATHARVTVTLATFPANADAVPVGEGHVDATIDTAAAAVEIPLTIGFTRDEVATGDPSRILSSTDGLGISIKYDPLPVDGAAGGLVVTGRVSLVPKGTYIDVPIWDTIRRNVADPGAKGNLLSVKALNDLPKFARPGVPRLFNYTILNEGPEPDVAVITSTFTGAKGWTASFFPGDTVPLLAGEQKAVRAGVAPPTWANESESVTFDLIVVSQKDPTARSSLATKIVATREGGVPQDLVPTVVVGKKKGLLPGLGPLELAGALGLLAVGLRRRRP